MRADNFESWYESDVCTEESDDTHGQTDNERKNDQRKLVLKPVTKNPVGFLLSHPQAFPPRDRRGERTRKGANHQ